MSGQSRYRSLWQRYYQDCHGVIFTVDSSDVIRLSVARNELAMLLEHPEIATKSCTPLLILANKCDLPGAIDISKVLLLLLVRSASVSFLLLILEMSCKVTFLKFFFLFVGLESAYHVSCP